MVPEISILKHILSYANWNDCKSYIALEDINKEIRPLFSAVFNHHTVTPDVNLTCGDLANLVYSNPVKDKDYIGQVIKEVDACDASPETTLILIHKLEENKKLRELSLLSFEVAEGRKPRDKFVEALQEFVEFSSNESEDSDEDFSFVTDDLETLVNEARTTPGLRWRLDTMNKMLGSLRKGDFGFVFARPETGKTTLLTSEVTFMASQIPEDDGPVVWLNNEEQGNKVMLRAYQAALGVDLTTLYSNIPVHKQAFMNATKGKFRLFDSGVIHKRTVENLCKRLKPSLLVFDQIDKIVGFDNDREDLKLGAIYQWARELAKEYCPVIGVCQADGTGEGVRWLTMSHVANAKTAKQAEADWILGIGRSNDIGFESIRFLHLSKNKLVGDEDTIPELRHGRREVRIEPMTARYEDL